MKKLKIGFVGCGGIATNKHMPSLVKFKEEVELVAFCDIIEEKATAAAKEFGAEDAKVYVDYKEMLKDETIDVIHVLTPNRSHSFISIDALNAGKNVMCEKPMAKTYAEAKDMVAAAKKSGKLLTIGYQYRRNTDADYANAVAKSGELGEIYYAKAHAIRRRAVPTWGVFLNEFEQGGGPLIDIGTHALDMTLWQMNNYKPKMVVGNIYKKLGQQTETANAWGDWDPKEFTVEDSAFGFITMENGATINLEASWALNSIDVGEGRTTLCGTLGGLTMKDGDVFVNSVKHNKQCVEKPSLEAGGVAFFDGTSMSSADLEQRTWIDALTKGTPLIVLPEQALVVTQILEAIYESAKTGKPVYFND